MNTNSRLDALAQKRARLMALSDTQRAELASYHARFEGPIRATSAVLGLASSLGRSPLAIAGLAALLMKTPWRKLARVPKLAWRGWTLWKFARTWIR